MPVLRCLQYRVSSLMIHVSPRATRCYVCAQNKTIERRSMDPNESLSSLSNHSPRSRRCSSYDSLSSFVPGPLEELLGVDRCAIELQFRSSSAASARSSSGRPRIYTYHFLRVYICICVSHGTTTGSTWSMARRFRRGIVDRPCLPTGYPPARDFRLSSLILDNVDLAVISDKTEKNPCESHSISVGSSLLSDSFIRRLPTVIQRVLTLEQSREKVDLL